MVQLFKELPWYEKVGVDILKCGPIPKHIAFIMDGNRRYLQKCKIESDANVGGRKVQDVTSWCLELGVQEVTLFAFSIHNYKRGEAAVKELMDMIVENYANIEDNLDEYRQKRVRIRVVGNLNLLPKEVQEIMERVVSETKDNRDLIINIALAYTFGDELTTSVKAIVDGVKSNSIRVDDIDDQLVYDCLYTNFVSKPDILIRTSGETRFSDFLLWQVEDAGIYFIKPLWPEITLWHMLSIFLHYQIHFMKNRGLKQLEARKDEGETRIRNFLSVVRENVSFKK